MQTGIGSTVLPKGDVSDIPGSDLAEPLLIEPPPYLTGSIIASGDFPLTQAGEAVRSVLAQFVETHLRGTGAPGAEGLG